jgi:N utilization substance protein B
MKVRRQARVVALQVLYEVDSADHPPKRVLHQRLEDAVLPQSAAEFVALLVSGVTDNQERLDTLIQRFAPEWPLDQIAAIDRNVLRIAAFELLIAQSAPPKVIINEAVELAKLFGADSSHRFVNGVLGALLHHSVQTPEITSYAEVGERT